MEIGKIYYEKYADAPEEDLEKQCRSIKNARHGIDELNKKINEIKGL
jgi:hypothetical protein